MKTRRGPAQSWAKSARSRFFTICPSSFRSPRFPEGVFFLSLLLPSPSSRSRPYIYIYFFFSTGRFTSDRWWRSSVALVASTFPAVFTRTKLWEPLSLAAPSAAYVDHLETTPHKKPTPFRKHSSAGRACARQGGPLRACGRVSIKYREIRLWILISPVTNEESRGRDRIRFSRFSISFDYVLFFGHREDRLLRILLSFLFLPRWKHCWMRNCTIELICIFYRIFFELLFSDVVRCI